MALAIYGRRAGTGDLGNSVNADADIQKALVGYQAAVALTTHYYSEAWSRFNAMVITNSIIMAGIGVVIVGDFTELRIALALGVAGLIMSVVWLVLVERGLQHGAYYICSARELETKYLSSVVKTVGRGEKFSKGGTVTIEVENPKEKIDGPGGLFHGRWGVRVVVAVFAVLYAASLLFSALLVADILSVAGR